MDAIIMKITPTMDLRQLDQLAGTEGDKSMLLWLRDALVTGGWDDTDELPDTTWQYLLEEVALKAEEDVHPGLADDMPMGDDPV